MWKLIVCIFINIKCFLPVTAVQNCFNTHSTVHYLFLICRIWVQKKFGDDEGLNIKFCFVHNHLPQSFVETAFLEKEQTPWQTRTVKEPRMKAQTKSSSQCPHKEQGMTI